MKQHTVVKAIIRFIDLLPLLIPSWVTAFGSVAIILLIFQNLQNKLFWPIAIITMILISLPILKYSQAKEISRGRLISNLAMLAFAVAWVIFNNSYASQHLVTNRDPGVYAVTGVRLVYHDNLEIKESNAFGKVSGIEGYSGGFSPDLRDKGEVAAQGTHILPAIIGLSGRIVGVAGMLRINVILGGLAILTLYGFSRRVVGPGWSLIAPVAVALTLPMLYFSRDTYTEPLSILFTFGALAMLWEAQVANKKSLWFIAGLIGGANALARIDGYLTVAALCAFTVIYVSLANKHKERVTRLNNSAIYLLGLATTSILGFLDVSILSSSYFASEWKNIKPELLLITLILSGGLLAILLSWKTDLLKILDKRTKKWRGKAGIIFVLIVAGFFVTRPLWSPVFQYGTDLLDNRAFAKKIVVTSFSKQASVWAVWYLGPILVAASILGLAVGIKRSLYNKNLLLVAGILVVGIATVFYFYRPRIAPDQIWASRRLLPVILPGLAVFGAFGLEYIHGLKKIGRFKFPGTEVTPILISLALFGSLLVSLPNITTREYALQQPLDNFCNTLPANAAVLWVGSARSELVEVTKSLCGVPAEGYGGLFKNTDKPTQEVLSQASKNARAEGLIPIIGVFGRDRALLSEISMVELGKIDSFTQGQIERVTTRPPILSVQKSETIMFGEIENDGTIKMFGRVEP